MVKVELLVSLKIPDTTAITAKNTIDGLNIPMDKLNRFDYYLFDVQDPQIFANEIVKADVVVNFNKHKAKVIVDDKEALISEGKGVLVKDIDSEDKKLLDTLTNRLGIKGLNNVQRGVLWQIFSKDESAAKRAAEELLHNKNYQEYTLL